MRADNAELVDRRHAADDGVIVDFHMPRQRGVVGQHTSVADHAVVGNVHVDHQQVVIAHFGQAGALRGAAVNGHAFADAVAIAHFNARRFARVFQIWFTSPMEAN